MRKIISVILFFVFIGPYIKGQDVSLSIISLTDKFRPLFSKESGVLTIDFVKQYSIGELDTSYVFVLNVIEEDLQETEMSFGGALFSGGGYGSGFSQSYKKEKKQDQVILNKDQFMEFFECVNKTYKFIASEQAYDRIDTKIAASCSSNNISIGGDYKPDNTEFNEVKFFFKVGDQATYEMHKSKFVKIVKVIRDVRDYWEVL